MTEEPMNTQTLVDKILQEGGFLAFTSVERGSRGAAGFQTIAHRIDLFDRLIENTYLFNGIEGVANIEQAKGYKALTFMVPEDRQKQILGFQGSNQENMLMVEVNDSVRAMLPEGEGIVLSTFSPEQYKLGTNIKKFLKQNNLNEVLSFSDLSDPEYERVIIAPEKRGFFGVGAKPAQTQSRPTGKRNQVLLSHIVKDGANAPAARIRYYVKNYSAEAEGAWRDYSGRDGQYLVVDMLVSAETAAELEKAVKSNPRLIRDLNDRIMREKILPGVSGDISKYWDEPCGRGTRLRPPYESFDKVPDGSKIGISRHNLKTGIHSGSIYKV